MRIVLGIMVVYLVACCQSSLIETLPLGRAAPEMLAITAAAAILLIGDNRALVFAGGLGLVGDILAPGRLGIGLAWYLLAAWLLLEVAERFDFRGLPMRTAASGLFAAITVFGIGGSRWLLGEPVVSPIDVIAVSAAVGLSTAALAVPVWITLGWLEARSRRRASLYGI